MPPVLQDQALADDHIRVENIGLRRLNWTLLVIYSLITFVAFFGEFDTRWSTAMFGYYYIAIGMPGWMVCWFSFMIFNEVHPVSRLWLVASMIVGVLAVVGYIGIG